MKNNNIEIMFTNINKNHLMVLKTALEVYMTTLEEKIIDESIPEEEKETENELLDYALDLNEMLMNDYGYLMNKGGKHNVR